MKQYKQNKNMTHTKQKSNKILLQRIKKNITRVITRNIPKTNVEQIKGNDKFYFYLYPLGT